MGQRLNIELQAEGIVLANAYYHWSGYTSSALNLTLQILNNMHIIDMYEDSVVAAIKLLEVTGAGLSEEEYLLLKVEDNPEDKFKLCTSRNNGIISTTEKGMETTRQWEEAKVTIDLGEELIVFDAIYITDPSVSNEEEMISSFGEDYKNLPELDVNDLMGAIPFEYFPTIASAIINVVNKRIYGFKIKGTSYYGSCIE